MKRELRYYQNDAINAIITDWLMGIVRTLISMPTGTGKTFTITSLFDQVLGQGDRLLVFIHEYGLMHQIYDDFNQVLGDRYRIGLVQGKKHQDYDADIVISMIQTAMYRETKQYGQFNYVWIDEAHHYVDNKWGETLLKFLGNGTKLLGCTATAYRADKISLGHTFTEIQERGSLTYTYTIQQAIRDKYLAPFTASKIMTDLTQEQLDMFRNMKMSNGFLGKSDEWNEMWEAGNWAELMYKEMEDREFPARLAMGFLPSVDISYQFAEWMAEEHDIATGHVDGEKSVIFEGNQVKKVERTDLYKAFRAGEVRFMGNFGVACLSMDTEILTQKGWKTHAQMSENDLVANWDDGEVYFEKPVGIHMRHRFMDEAMITLDTPRRKLRVTSNHQMVYRKRKDAAWEICSAVDLVGQRYELPVSGIADPSSMRISQDQIPDRRRAISANAYVLRQSEDLSYEDSKVEAARRFDERYSLRYSQPNELTLDECRLIGFWLADGTANRLQSGGIEYRLTQSLTYPEIIKWIDDLLSQMNIDYLRKQVPDKKPNRNDTIKWSLPRGTGFGPQKRKGLYNLEPYLFKDGSLFLWGLNTEQFDAFIEGLMMGDGEHDNDHRYIRISNKVKPMLDLIQAIAVCRGYRASIKGPDKRTGVYILSLTKRDAHCLNHKGLLQVEEWTEEYVKENVWCVTSTSRMIVTRKDGSATITGNTEGFDNPDIEILLLGRPTKSEGLYTQMLGRGLRVGVDIPAKHADILHMNFEGHRLADYKSLIGGVPSKETNEVEKKLTEITNGEEKTFPCNLCGGNLNRIEGTESYICSKCEAFFDIPGAVTGDPDEQLFDASKLNGVGTHAQILDLFANQEVRWHFQDGIYSTGIGTGQGLSPDGVPCPMADRIIMVLPPGFTPAYPESWVIYMVAKEVIGKEAVTYQKFIKGRPLDFSYDKYKYGRYSTRGRPFEDKTECFDYAVATAVALRNKRLADKDQDWMKKEASKGQKSMLDKFGYDTSKLNGNGSKGLASVLISHYIGKEQLMKSGEIDMPDLTQSNL